MSLCAVCRTESTSIRAGKEVWTQMLELREMKSTRNHELMCIWKIKGCGWTHKIGSLCSSPQVFEPPLASWPSSGQSSNWYTYPSVRRVTQPSCSVQTRTLKVKVFCFIQPPPPVDPPGPLSGSPAPVPTQATQTVTSQYLGQYQTSGKQVVVM